jgi:small ligand-binding sensory domain FIST
MLTCCKSADEWEPDAAAIEIGEIVEVGATVQFHIRDAAVADKDLRLSLERAGAEPAGRPVGALLFTCNGRGRRMFGVGDHDASTISDLLGGIPLAGFFTAGRSVRSRVVMRCTGYGIDGCVCRRRWMTRYLGHLPSCMVSVCQTIHR